MAGSHGRRAAKPTAVGWKAAEINTAKKQRLGKVKHHKQLIKLARKKNFQKLTKKAFTTKKQD